MGSFGSSFVKKMIVGVITTVIGAGSIATVAGGIMDVASGSPVKEVAKNVVMDSAKDKAVKALNGAIQENDSFNSQKYQSVSYDKSGVIGYWKPGWDSEVYGYEDGVYIGNRSHNKPTGMNLKWNNRNAMDFEIGDFKKDNVKSGEYIGYDSDTFSLVFGTVEKYKLNGLVVEYDEYSNTATVSEYKKGKEKTEYATISSDNDIKYITDESELEDSDISISGDESGYTIQSGAKTIFVDCADDRIVYSSNTYDFDGNAFKFLCSAAIEDNVNEDWISYDYEVANKIHINQSDGTDGEVMLVSESDKENVSDDHVNIEALSKYLIKEGAHATVEILIENRIGVINDLVEITTGESVSDRVNDVVDDVVDGVADSVKEKMQESTEQSSEYHDERQDRSFDETMEDLNRKGIKITFNEDENTEASENSESEQTSESNEPYESGEASE